MIIFIKAIFILSGFNIFWANIGYPLFVLMLGKLNHKKNNRLDNYYPNVTIMVVAHNEEKVIHQKLDNLQNLEYPSEKIKILVASDNSTDKTNEIVLNYINKSPKIRIQLVTTKKRMGKTNAQNEAQKTVTTEFLVMTDANSMLEKNSIYQLMSSFSDESISYVTGKLIYINDFKSSTSENEATYWTLDLKIREIESRLQTITAGNGALYAIRNSEYVDFSPIKSHDSSMPIYYALNKKRAIANHQAIAYEKAGENEMDEFNRKVRMNRVLLSHILPSLKIINIFKYKWFTIFYLGHRTSRYLLWLSHTLLFLSNVLMSTGNIFFSILLFIQIIIYLIAYLHKYFKFNNRVINLIYYYCLTVVAQYVGVFNSLTGKAKPFWQKAESTR